VKTLNVLVTMFAHPTVEDEHIRKQLSNKET